MSWWFTPPRSKNRIVKRRLASWDTEDVSYQKNWSLKLPDQRDTGIEGTCVTFNSRSPARGLRATIGTPCE